jgi:uncharacterized protein (TIGR02594 family)
MSKLVCTTAYEVAKKFLGIKEIPGYKDNPFIVWALSLCGLPDSHDEVPWCSAFVHVPCLMLGLPTSGSAAARSWLKIGRKVSLDEAEIGFDIVILKRGIGEQPGPEIINAPGHVGFFGGIIILENKINLLAGNQHNSVSIEPFGIERILDIRRIYE